MTIAGKLPEIMDGVTIRQYCRAFGRRGAKDAHLLKWQIQPTHRGSSWEKTIRYKRRELAYNLKKTPSLKFRLADTEWFDLVWENAVTQAAAETGLDIFPDFCPWDFEQSVNPEFRPE